MSNSFLKRAIKEKKLIGIRTNAQDWDEVIIGFVVELNEHTFIINEIDQIGQLIGNTTLEMENIISIEYNDRYQKRLQYIFENHSKFNINNQVTIWKEGSALISYFNDLVKSKKIITFYFDEDNFVIGILLNFDEDNVIIKNIGTEGDEDGESCYLIDHLIGIKYDGIDEQKIKLLYDNASLFY